MVFEWYTVDRFLYGFLLFKYHHHPINTIDIINGTLLNGIFGFQWYTVRLFVIIQNTIET